MNNIHVSIPSKKMLVCGGYAQASGPIKSLRGAFLRFAYGKAPFSSYEIIIAEDLQEQYEKSKYKDLLMFESDLAQVSSLILLFSESYGSAAELGAFCILETIAARLLVVIDAENYDSASFVKQGPLQRLLDTTSPHSVHVLYKEELGIDSFSEADFPKIDLGVLEKRLKEAVDLRKKTIPDSSTFNESSVGHKILFVVGIVQQYGALRIDELQSLLKGFRLNWSDFDVENMFSCAEVMGWIKKRRIGSFDHYVSLASNFILSFPSGFKKGVSITEWRMNCSNYWKENDYMRFKIIADERSSS